MPTLSEATERLHDAVRPAEGGLVLVVTGAGISRASGIATFRGPENDAVWKVSDVELATAAYFDTDPVGQWEWYLARFRKVDAAQPNPAHLALADLECRLEALGGRLAVVTQNIDTLHEQAGTTDLIKIHGTSDRVRCSAAGCANAAPRGSIARSEIDLARFAGSPSASTLPRCPLCDSPLRAHVLFFDEYYQEHEDYRFQEALAVADRASTVIFAGTSFSVGITDMIARSANSRRVPTFSIDPTPSPHARLYDITHLAAPAEDVLPALVETLGGTAI